MPSTPFFHRSSQSPARSDERMSNADGSPRAPPTNSNANSRDEPMKPPPRSILRQSHGQTPQQHYEEPNYYSRRGSLPQSPTSGQQHQAFATPSNYSPHASVPRTPRASDVPQPHLYYEGAPPNLTNRIPTPRTPRDVEPFQKRNSLPAFNQSPSTDRDRFMSLPEVYGTPEVELDRFARAHGAPVPMRRPQHRQGDVGSSSDAHFSRFQGRFDEAPGPRSGIALPPAEPQHPHVPRASPNQMYRRLDALVRRDKHRAMDYLAFEDVVELYKRDTALREQMRERKGVRTDRDPHFRVVGTSLHEVVLHAGASIVLGDYVHDLPIVVLACVEELNRTGIYQQGLFRALPNRDRHLKLIQIYDTSADFGVKFSMRGQMMPDICALLSTYISSLPSPVLDPHLYGAFWHWCVKPSVKREDERREQREWEEEELIAAGKLVPRPKSKQAQLQAQGRDDLRLDSSTSLESDQIAIAQVILRFLPVPNLSLLVYLCQFFTQLPLSPDNGIQFEDIARIFGHRLLGGSMKTTSQKMMVWLLMRWPLISESLFTDRCGIATPTADMPSPDSPPNQASPSERPPHEDQDTPHEDLHDAPSESRRSHSPVASASRDTAKMSEDPPPSSSPTCSSESSRDNQSSSSRRREKRGLEMSAYSDDDSSRKPHRSKGRSKSGHRPSLLAERSFRREKRRSSGSQSSDRFSRGGSHSHSTFPPTCAYMLTNRAW
ncbi:Rho GTPase activation protein [Leucogyrophana mollusca]|uniref:Rho GTPase activation protein n=1 Tax=Leucogyrophana mollusca TaxID=85980 RepID=A0ACB8B554_9AGAM|nr:Rho GTPase activation protein [Leucogyrophana mollusca]